MLPHDEVARHIEHVGTWQAMKWPGMLVRFRQYLFLRHSKFLEAAGRRDGNTA